MPSRILLLVSLGLGVIPPVPSPSPQRPGAPPSLPASSAKVETLTLAPSEAGRDFYVAPHGGHVAAISQKGSRFVVVHDGVTSPPFDEIVGVNPKLRIIFSDDGARYAYVGRQGQEFVVMVDGKEANRLPVATTRWDFSARFPEFGPKGKHVYFVFRTKKGTSEYFHQLVVDGQPVPVTFHTPKGLVFSPDGERYAYVSASDIASGPWGLIVDGKPAGYQGSDPIFTGDGLHLLTRTQLAGNQGVGILADGKPFIRAQDVKLYIAPAGSGVVSVVSRLPDSTNPNSRFLVIGGKKVEGSDAAGIPHVYFSPDGKHWAAECEAVNRFRFMIIDGKKGQEYEQLRPVTKLGVTIAATGMQPTLMFSRDSSRTAYIGRSGNKEFLVVDGQESPEGYPFIVALNLAGPQGKRVGYVGLGSNSRDRSMVIDGKMWQSNFAFDDLTFSPDGSKYAYTTMGDSGTAARSSHMRLVVDGIAQEGIAIIPMISTRDNAPVKFVLSPDGKHAVHFGGVVNEQRAAFVIDGRLVAGFSQPSNPTFTPDGRHFLHYGQTLTAAGTPGTYTVYVDGRPATQVAWGQDNDDLMRKVPGGWEMGADGVLTFIAHVGNNIQRIRITPPEDTSIDTMIASGSRGR